MDKNLKNKWNISHIYLLKHSITGDINLHNSSPVLFSFPNSDLLFKYEDILFK